MKRLLVVSLAAFSLALTFETVSQAQDDAKKNAESLFSTLDKNEDGSIEADEVEEKTKRFFDRLVRVGDENEDGKLSKAEFIKAMTANDPTVRVPQNRGGDQRGSDRNRQLFFERLDKNNDQKLTLDELPETFRPRFKPLFERLGKDEITLEDLVRDQGTPNRNPTNRNRVMFNSFDKNNDRKVSLSELPERLQERLKPAFERLDKDALTFEEFSRVLSGGNRNPDQNPNPNRDRARMAETYFDRLDTNKDGQISMLDAQDNERVTRSLQAMFRVMKKGEGDTISKEEFLKFYQERQAQRPNTTRPAERPAPAIYRILDTNGDQKLSKEELSKAAEKFEELDTNNDGSIDLRELFGSRPATRPGQGRRPNNRPETDRPRRPETDRPATDRPRD